MTTDAAHLLHSFARKAAQRAVDDGSVIDARCLKAIDAKIKWLRGNVTDEELEAVWEATGAAPGRVVAQDAAQDAYYISMWICASAASRAAIRARVPGYTWDDAAWAATRELHNRMLMELCEQ